MLRFPNNELDPVLLKKSNEEVKVIELFQVRAYASLDVTVNDEEDCRWTHVTKAGIHSARVT